MNTKLIVGGVVLAVIAAVGLTVTAAVGGQGHGRGGPGGPPFGPPDPARMISRLTEDLDLTTEQVDQVKAIFAEEESATEPYRTTLHDLDTQLHDATANGQFDETKVREIAGKQAAAMTELIVARERGKAKTYAVLTPEQRTKFEQLRPQGPPPGAGKHAFGSGR